MKKEKAFWLVAIQDHILRPKFAYSQTLNWKNAILNYDI